MYPVWFGFRGGKGVATMIGVVGALDPRLLLPVIGDLVRRARAQRIRGTREHARGRGAGRVRFLVRARRRAAAVHFARPSSFSSSSPTARNIARMHAGNENRVQQAMAVPIPDGVELRRVARAARRRRGALGRGAGAGTRREPRPRSRRAIERLKALGVEIGVAAGARHRLSAPVGAARRRRIRAALGREPAGELRRLEVLFEVDSTNTRLLAAPAPPTGLADVCLCELQSAGRGRRGRRWMSPFGASLALSLGWTFRRGARASNRH